MSIKRQQIMDALRDRLQGITRANGYCLDLGKNVIEWRSSKWEDAAIPGIAYRDPGDEIEESGQKDLHSLRVELEAMVSGDGGDVAAQMRQAVADISGAIGTDETFGELILYCRTLGTTSTDIEHAGKKFGFVKMVITMQYITPKWGV